MISKLGMPAMKLGELKARRSNLHLRTTASESAQHTFLAASSDSWQLQPFRPTSRIGDAKRRCVHDRGSSPLVGNA